MPTVGHRLPRKSCTNDLWMAVGQHYGLNDFTLGENDPHTAPIRGLFG
jgi:hypothetical protein